MKKIFLFVYILIPFVALAQSTKAGELKYKVDGKITGFKQKYILFERLTLNQATVLDSIPYKNGEFSFSGNISEPGLYRIRTGISLANAVLVVLSEKENNIIINADSASTTTFSYSVNGSVATTCVKNILAEAIGRYNAINKLSNEVYAQANMTDADKEKIYRHIDTLAITNRNYIYHFIDTVRNPIVAIFSAVSFLNPDQDFKEWDNLETRIKKENDGFPLAKEFIDRVDLQRNYGKDSHPQLQFKEGDILPDIQLKDTSGNTLSLYSLRGQYVLVDFWASWCGPCRAENPNVVKAYKNFHSKGFTVFSVSLDTDKSRWEKAINTDKLEWPTHVSELRGWSSSVCSQFGIEAIPNNFLIDKDGKVVGISLRGEGLTNTLTNLLK